MVNKENMPKTEKYTVNDFTLNKLQTNASDRAISFQNWMNQTVENEHQIYWNESLGAVGPEMQIINPKTFHEENVISFVSNDYLGMSQKTETKQAGIDAILKYGTGACAAPIIGGYLDIHRELESNIAAFVGQEDALVFSSGFGVNVGVLNALLGKDDLALIDLQVHTSVLDGLRGTNVKRMKHNDIEYLKFTLKNQSANYKTKIVIVDGVYSQDGDVAPLPEIQALCKEYGALLYVDDAHGVGVFGENGRGTAEYYDMLGEVDIITGTFSKSFGTVGGFVACSKFIADYLRYNASTTVFSAALTPQSTASVLKALELMQSDTHIKDKLWQNVDYFKKRLQEENFEIMDSNSPIFPIMVKDPYKAKEVSRLLKLKGIYAIAIVFPAVTDKNARIRISLTASHEIEHLDHLINSLIEIRKVLVF